MRHFTQHMSVVVAAATVNGMEAIANCIKAYERTGEARRECLHEAKSDLLTWLSDIDRAIGAEIAAHHEQIRG